MNRQETLALLKRIKTVLKHSRHIWVTAISESRLYLPTTFSRYLIMSNVFFQDLELKNKLCLSYINILFCTIFCSVTWRHFWSFSLAACIDTWQGSLSESWQFPLPSSNLLFAAIECGIYQISICTMISLFIRSVNSS